MTRIGRQHQLTAQLLTIATLANGFDFVVQASRKSPANLADEPVSPEQLAAIRADRAKRKAAAFAKQHKNR